MSRCSLMGCRRPTLATQIWQCNKPSVRDCVPAVRIRNQRLKVQLTALQRNAHSRGPSQSFPHRTLVMIHDSILSTIGRTPVVKINRLAPAHVQMYVKCELFNPLSSVKD